MPRIDPVDPATATGERKEMLDVVRGRMGMVPNLLATLARAPAALGAYLELSARLGRSHLRPALREQVALAVAEANACSYCLAVHGAYAAHLKLPDEEILANRQARSSDPKTEAALRFARAVVDTRGFVSDDALAEVRAAGYDDERVLEVVTTVALNLLTNYASHVAEVDLDFPAAPPLERAA